MDLPVTYEALLKCAYVWLNARETASHRGRPSASEGDTSGKRRQRSGQHEDWGRFAPYPRDSSQSVLSSLSKTPREILTTEKVAHTFRQPPKMTSKGKGRDPSNFCEFHNDYGHDTNFCDKLKAAIEEAVKSGKLAHLIRGIRQQKPKAKTVEASPEERKIPTEPVINMVRVAIPKKRKDIGDKMPSQDITFPSIEGRQPSTDLVVIGAMIFNRPVHRVYLDGGSECDIIYEHCFLHLKPAIRSRMSEPKTPLLGFAGGRIWPLGEIDLDITIGEPPYQMTETC